MPGTWREELEQKIQAIREKGSPAPMGEGIYIKADLSSKAINAFELNVGRVNDLPFCGADPGTLEIRKPVNWPDGTALAFLLRQHPHEDFGSTLGGTKARGPQGEYRTVVLGVDFAKVLPE